MSENWKLEELPVRKVVENRKILKRLPKAHAALAELKGIASTIPNQNILINTLGLQEAKDSSAIENIITTHDDLYKTELNLKSVRNLDAKEVQNYIAAMKKGFQLVSNNHILSSNMILQIQEILERNKAGFRKLPGTTLKNAVTGEVIYTPPQGFDRISALMANLESFINDNSISDYDPLVKMAIIHYQFESIHPFYDGNGRTGRIINILYLILNKLLDLPILYLSKFIIQNKGDYYRLLQKVRDDENWEEWVLFIIQGVTETAIDTIELVRGIKALMLRVKHQIREGYKFYSQDLINNLFKHPYTKIEFVMIDLNVSRITASNYLNKLAKDGILLKQRVGNSNYYINTPLLELMTKR